MPNFRQFDGGLVQYHMKNLILKGTNLKMANSGIYWVDVTFDWCVRLLHDIAGVMGITYEEINVWLFIIITPTVLLLSITLNIWLVLKSELFQRFGVE